MKKALRFTMAVLAALVFTAARADGRGNPAATGPARDDGGDPLAYKPPEERTSREGTGKGGEAAIPHESENRDEAEGPGSAGREPGRAEDSAEAGIGSSVHVDPGYYVQDPSDGQFLLETWTAGG